VTLAEAVIAADDAVDALHRELDVRTLDLMARQQPVAGDLRTLVTSLRMSADLKRMGGLTGHIAKIARTRYPDCAVSEDLCATITRLGEIGVEFAARLAGIIEGKDVTDAETLDAEDDAVDRLHRAIFETLSIRHLERASRVGWRGGVSSCSYSSRAAVHVLDSLPRLVRGFPPSGGPAASTVEVWRIPRLWGGSPRGGLS
jgi:phosphate uptake regulator